MRQTIVVGDIPIEVSRKRIKHAHLRVHAPDGRVTISAPSSVRRQVLEAFAASRMGWILRQQERAREQARETCRRYEDGERHNLWGRQRVLHVVERDGRPAVAVDDDRIVLFIHHGSDVARRAHVIHAWHKSVLHEVLPGLITTWEQRLNVRLAAYHLRQMKTRWGTCNPRTGHIRLNTELVKKPAHLLEYVLVHEMVHLIVPNHGPQFVALMNEHYPSWREARAKLSQSPSWT